MDLQIEYLTKLYHLAYGRLRGNCLSHFVLMNLSPHFSGNNNSSNNNNNK